MPGNIKHTVGAGLGGFRGDHHRGLEETYSREMTKGMIGTDAVTYEGSFDHYNMKPIILSWEDRNTDNNDTKLNNSKPLLGLSNISSMNPDAFQGSEYENHKRINRDNAVLKKLDTKDKKAFKSRGGS
jgi:hypothetical protein